MKGIAATKAWYGKPRTIYGLRRPGTIPIRYVGQTTNCKQRLAAHMTKAHCPAMRRWVERLKRDGLVAEMVVLTTAEGHWNATVAERRWIRSLSVVFGRLLLNQFYRGDFVRLSHFELSAKLEGQRQRRKRWRAELEVRRASWHDRIIKRQTKLLNYKGERVTLATLAKRIGVSRERMRQRVARCRQNGVDLAEAYETPAGQCMPSFAKYHEKYRLRIANRNASMVENEWFDGAVHVIKRGQDWSEKIACRTFGDIIQAEAKARGGKCKFRILNDHVMFVFELKKSAVA